MREYGQQFSLREEQDDVPDASGFDTGVNTANQAERENQPNFVRLSPEESKSLFGVADKLWRNTTRRFVGDTNGVILVLMDMIRNFDNMPEEQKKALAPIRDKIAQTYPIG